MVMLPEARVLLNSSKSNSSADFLSQALLPSGLLGLGSEVYFNLAASRRVVFQVRCA